MQRILKRPFRQKTLSKHYPTFRIRRLKNREQRSARVISFNEIRRGVQNDPVQAIEYVETFLLHSTVGKRNHEAEPLTTTGAF